MIDVIRDFEDELKPILNRIGGGTGHMGSNIGKEARDVVKKTKSNVRTLVDEVQIRTGMKRRGIRSHIKRADTSIRKSIKNLRK